MIHQGEAKLAVAGTSGDSNFIHTFVGPGGSREVPGKNGKVRKVKFAEDLDLALQERAYYESQLGTLQGSSSSFDVLKKIEDSRVAEQTTNRADGLKLALDRQAKVSSTSGLDKGIAAYDYTRSYAKLQSLGLSNQDLAQFGLTHPENLHAEHKNEPLYEQGFITRMDSRELAENTANSLTTQVDQESIIKKRNRLLAEKQMATHVAGYLEENFGESRDAQGLVKQKRSIASRSGLEAAALNDYLEKNSVPQEEQTPETTLQVVQGNRNDLLKKHLNKAMLLQTEASNFKLTPELYSSFGGSLEAIKALGGNPAEHGLSLLSLFAKGGVAVDPSKALSNVLNLSTQPTKQANYLEAKRGFIESASQDVPEISADDRKLKILSQALDTTREKIKAYRDAIAQTKDESIKVSLRTDMEKEVLRSKNIIGHMTNLTPSDTDIHTANYEQNKAERTKRQAAAAGELSVELEKEGFSPELLSRINKLSPNATSLFSNLSHENLGRLQNEFMSNDDNKTKAAKNLVMSSSAAAFTSEAQTIKGFKENPNSITSSGVNIFDTIFEKEKQAERVIQELQSQIVKLGGTSLDSLDQEFISIYKNIQNNITSLKEYEADFSKVNTKDPGYVDRKKAHDEHVQVATGNINDDLGRLRETRQKMIGNRPKITDEAWGALKESALVQNETTIQNLTSRHMNAVARVEALGGGSSYADIQEAHSTAKELRQRGVTLSPEEQKRAMSESDVEKFAKKHGKTNFQDVSFTEQLVDLANWQIQWAGATAVTQGFTAALYGGYGAAREFEASMKDVELISQASSVQMENLKEKVMDLGSNFKVPVKELADGLVVLGQAGYKASDSVQMIQPISQLAVATGSSHKTATDITTSVMMAYDRPAAATADVTNTLAAATIESKLELGSLGTTFNYIGSTAAMAGLSIEETATAMGLMSNAGVKASTIGTSLRSILGALIAPTANFKAELGRVGISIDELNPRTNNLGSIMSKLNTKGFSVENAFEGMNKREAGALVSLLNQSDKWGNFQTNITGTDRAETMAVGQMDTFDAQVKRMHNNATVAGVKVYSGALEPLKAGTKQVGDVFGLIGNMAESEFGRAAKSIISTGIVAMTAATAVTTLAKSVVLVGGAAKEGLNKTWGTSFKTLATDDPKRSRMHEGVASLLGLGLSKSSLAIGLGLFAGSYAIDKIATGDKAFGFDIAKEGTFLNRFSDRTTNLKLRTLHTDALSNLQDTTDTASKQAAHIRLFPHGFDSEKQAFVNSLAATNVFAANDANGQVVDMVDYSKHKSLPPRSLAIDKQLQDKTLDVKSISEGMSMYNLDITNDKQLKQVVNTAAGHIKKPEDLYSEKGKNYVQYASDQFMSAIKAKNITYDDTKSTEFLNKYLGNSEADTAIKQQVQERREVLKSAPNRTELEASADKDYFKRSARDVIGINAVLTNPQSTTALSYKYGVRSMALGEAIKEPEVDAVFKNNKDLREGYYKRLDKYDRTDSKDTASKDAAYEDILHFLEIQSNKSGLQSLKGLRQRTESMYSSEFSLEKLKEKTENVSDVYKRKLVEHPEQAKDQGEYSTARQLFKEKSLGKIDEYATTVSSLEKARQELSKLESAPGGKESDQYKAKAIEVNAYKMAIEDLAITLKQLQQESFKFNMPGVDKKLIPTIVDLKYAAKFSNERPNSSMAYLPTVAISEYRSGSDSITKKYNEIKNQAMIAGDEKLLKTVHLAWKLEQEDLLEEIITKTTVKVKEASDKIDSIVARELQNKNINIQLKVDVGALDIDTKLADAKKDAIMSGRDSVAGNKNFTATDFTRYGFPSYQEYPNTKRWTSFADVFNTSNYSSEMGFAQNIQAEMAKLSLSKEGGNSTYEESMKAAEVNRLQGIKTAYATTAPGMQFKLPQTPAELAEATANAPDTTKLKLIEVENKYQEARIAASSKALNQIKKDIESEMALRDKLLNKIKELDDSKQTNAKEVDSIQKDLRKSAGIDTRKNSEDIDKNMDKLLEKAKGYSKEGKVDKLVEVRQAMIEQSRELMSDNHGNYWKLKQADRFKEFVPLFDKAVEQRKAIYGEDVNNLSEDSGNGRTKLESRINTIKSAIGNSTTLSDEEKKIQLTRFNERIAASSNNYEKMQAVKEAVAGSNIANDMTGDTTGAIAFEDLIKTMPELTAQFQALIPVIRALTGKTGEGDKEQKSLADFGKFAKTVGTDVMATFGSNTGSWIPNKLGGDKISQYWDNQMSPAYKEARTNPYYKALTDSIDPVNAIGLGVYGQGFSSAAKAVKVPQIAGIANTTDFIRNVSDPDQIDASDFMDGGLARGVNLSKIKAKSIKPKFSKLTALATVAGILSGRMHAPEDASDVTPSKSDIEKLIGTDEFKNIGLDKVSKMPITQLVDKGDLGEGVAGSFDRENNVVKATDTKSIKHELRHYVQKIKQFRPNSKNPFINAMQYEADADAKDDEVSDDEFVANYGLPRNLNFENLSEQQQLKLGNSVKGNQYRSKGLYARGIQHSLENTPENQNDRLNLWSMYGRNVSRTRLGVATVYNKIKGATIGLDYSDKELMERRKEAYAMYDNQINPATEGFISDTAIGKTIDYIASPEGVATVGNIGKGVLATGKGIYSNASTIKEGTKGLYKKLITPKPKKIIKIAADAEGNFSGTFAQVTKVAEPVVESITAVEQSAVAAVENLGIIETSKQFVNKWIGKTLNHGAIPAAMVATKTSQSMPMSTTYPKDIKVKNQQTNVQASPSYQLEPQKGAYTSWPLTTKGNPVDVVDARQLVEQSEGNFAEVYKSYTGKDLPTPVSLPTYSESEVKSSKEHVAPMSNKEFIDNQLESRTKGIKELKKGKKFNNESLADLNKSLGFNPLYGIKKNATMLLPENPDDKYRNLGQNDYVKLIEEPKGQKVTDQVNSDLNNIGGVSNPKQTNIDSKLSGGKDVTPSLSEVTSLVGKDPFTGVSYNPYAAMSKGNDSNGMSFKSYPEITGLLNNINVNDGINGAPAQFLDSKSIKRIDGGYSAKLTDGQDYNVASDSVVGKKITENAILKDAKELTKPQLSLENAPNSAVAELAKGSVPSASIDGVAASNTALIASLDSLRTSIDKTVNVTPDKKSSSTTSGKIDVNVAFTVTGNGAEAPAGSAPLIEVEVRKALDNLSPAVIANIRNHIMNDSMV